MLDSAARIDADLAGVMDALAGVRADVVATASKILDTETPGAEAFVRETLRAAIADHQADGPVTRETMGTLASLISAGTAARTSQAAYVAEQERLAAEAAAKAAAEAAAAAAAAQASEASTRGASSSQGGGSSSGGGYTPVEIPADASWRTQVVVCDLPPGAVFEIPNNYCHFESLPF